MTKETDKMKAIKQQRNKMRIVLTIITLLVANGLWAQKNNGYSPKFKKGQFTSLRWNKRRAAPPIR